jgi:Ca2+-binding EF-hand superfamily protein
MAHPFGKITKSEFIRENMDLKGGSEALWNNVFKLMDMNNDGSIDVEEFIKANIISSQDNIQAKVTWMFQLIDDDNSGSIDEEEMKKFLEMLHTTKSFIEDDAVSLEELIKNMLPILDPENNKKITLQNFIKATSEDKDLLMLINSFTNIISYKVELEKYKQSTDDIDSLDQVAGHSGGLKSIVKKGDKIWKPLNQTEYEFYEEITNRKTSPIRKFTCGYYGRNFINYGDDVVQQYIMIDNLLEGMKKPCVIDLKMGSREVNQKVN